METSNLARRSRGFQRISACWTPSVTTNTPTTWTTSSEFKSLNWRPPVISCFQSSSAIGTGAAKKQIVISSSTWHCSQWPKVLIFSGILRQT